MTPIISPSLLSCDFTNIESELKAFEGVPGLWFHLDVMDGHFVPNLTFGHPIIKKLAPKTEHLLDAHCMVSNPEFYAETFAGMGIHNFTFHFEAASAPLEIIKTAKKNFPSVGISIKPKTPFSALSDEVLEQIDLLLVMSVEPGFSGQSFIEGTWQKLEEIRIKKAARNYRFMVQVDGGVSDANGPQLIEAGCANLVAGSYIFKVNQGQYKDQVERLRQC